MEAISFFVPGPTVPYARSGGNGRIRFTPAPQRNFMNLVKTAAADAMADQPLLTGPLALTLRADFVRPASWSRKKAAATVWRTSKPDISNIVKIVEDAMNGVVFADDSQIVQITAQKRYAEKPGIVVTVQTLEPEEGART